MSNAQTAPALFQPIKVGAIQLKHRIVLAPLTRFRADDNHAHTDLAVEYYAQRASTPGTLLITEATLIAPRAGGYLNVPGIWNDAQIAAWKKITDAVHAKGSFMYMQLWALGRVANPKVLEEEGPYDLVGASSLPVEDGAPIPRPLEVDEIKEFVQLYAQAAKNAVHSAGFDGVEIHAAGGYLPDQFLQSNSNDRTDEYGGSIDNRIRFASEVVQAVAAAVGPERTGIKISPWSPWQGMHMPDPIPTFSALIAHLATAHPKLAYLHVMEPGINGQTEFDNDKSESNDFVHALWSPRPLIVAGGYTREGALEAGEDENVLVAVGRRFTSNPDLPKRWMVNAKITPYDRSTFYSGGAKGYADWPFLSEDVDGQESI